MTRPVLITGATGFVGSAVSRTENTRPMLRIARRGKLERDHPVHAVDVTDRSALLEAARGAGSIIHCVSYVGPDTDYAWHVNDEGTRVLVDVAKKLSIQNLLYVSTAGVYGGGKHVHAGENALTVPVSEASRSRRSAERRVLDAGGSVIRPHLTYGAGDRWFIPRLVSAADLLGGLPRGVKTSTISVDALAQQTWMLHDHIVKHEDAGVYNALHDKPTTLQAILWEWGTHFAPRHAQPVPLDPRRARDQLLHHGVSPHQADMLTTTNTFSSALAFKLPGLSGSRSFRLSPTALAWYHGTIW